MTSYTQADMLDIGPEEFRRRVRSGEWQGSAHGPVRGYAMTDIAIMPKEYAFDFMTFHQRNPGVGPVIDVTDVGSPRPPLMGPNADLRTDIVRYQVFVDGVVVDEPADINKYWRDDLVGFVLGGGSSTKWALDEANVAFKTLGVFSTNIPTIPAGPFRGNLTVTAKLFRSSYDAIRAIQITSRHYLSHGAPIHIGDPKAIGITDLFSADLITADDLASPTDRRTNQEVRSWLSNGGVLVYWHCGATNRKLAEEAKLPLMIVDYPNTMFVTDKRAEEIAIF